MNLLRAFVAVSALAVLSACAPATTAPAASWSPDYNADWASACACWGYVPARKPYVIERDDCLDFRGVRYFATPDSPTGYATGTFDPSRWTVEYCDERALRHEFSHAVLFAKTGSPGSNGNGRCWL